MTGYITKSHYRAPETMLTWQQYSQAVDIWKTICTKNVSSWQMTPSAWYAYLDCRPLKFIQSLPHNEGSGLETKLKKRHQKARLNAALALEHPYLSPYHDPSDEPMALEQINWSWEVHSDSVDSWQLEMFVHLKR
ncbi:mitogen-activated protein kinase HOG1 variant 2 [Penicillium citrinum]|uniref:Mitogen-activated protein kinase HOG1 variant 2 n=1 Tax=Penicillium citrinum TaxID=5077 RepID=A0A9W9PHA2_PENCI|nr:mitogen-activated protein kinase HOG1 variant 2 [Penicillium citrinum]KAJ5242953.1 mitogen-activated protein kinase HOG1 variant 2 [Penicillium citrinum]